MKPDLERAVRIARDMETGYTLLDTDLCKEVGELISALVIAIEARDQKLSAAVLALNYYRDPSLYLMRDTRAGSPILDDGMRARTALAVIYGTGKRTAPLRVPLPDFD